MLDEMYHRENINVQIQKVEFQTDYIVSKKEKQEIIQDALRSKEVTKGMKGIGAYSIRANQMMESIPIIGTAILGIKETIEDECYNELGDGYCNIEFRFEDEQNIEISLASFYSEQETILPNMNVCHFDKIKQSIVDMIRKGKMENVYSMLCMAKKDKLIRNRKIRSLFLFRHGLSEDAMRERIRLTTEYR